MGRSLGVPVRQKHGNAVKSGRKWGWPTPAYRVHEQCFCMSLSSSVFRFSAYHESTLALLKSVEPMKHSSTMYSRLTINFLNHLKCFCGTKAGFPAKTNHCTLLNCFFHYDLWHEQNIQFTSHREYVPHCEWFELKHGMCGEGNLLVNFAKFYGDCATSTMFL